MCVIDIIFKIVFDVFVVCVIDIIFKTMFDVFCLNIQYQNFFISSLLYLDHVLYLCIYIASFVVDRFK